jgi:hypothetical protein
MKYDVCAFVFRCDIFQCNKEETIKDPGTLQPLLIPPTIWKDIFMDFFLGLPKSRIKSDIMVVVDFLSKYAHLCALQHLFTASTVAQSFMDNIFKLHGMPHLLSLTEIQLSPAIFGKNFSGSRETNCISTSPIIPKLISKLKLSKSVWKHICCVFHLIEKISGLSGYP